MHKQKIKVDRVENWSKNFPVDLSDFLLYALQPTAVKRLTKINDNI